MGEVLLPFWLFLLLLALALTAVLDRLLVPSVRWYLRSRALRVIDEVNTRLHIEVKPFQRTRRQVLIERLLYDARVQEAVEQHAREHNVPRELAMERVERYAREIVPAFNAYAYFRLGYAVARRVARFLYRVRLGHSDDEGLSRVRRGSTVVFVMNHRSNMDYVLVGYLAADRAALSYAVGEWARVWPLQTLVRSMGAYFVRRDSGDPLYRRVLERYVYMATSAGVTQALYPEGGLSRDGRLRPPKLGLLQYLLRGYEASRSERDLVFVPVGINYDRTLEDRTLLLDLDPGAPREGRLAAIWRASRFLASNLVLMARGRWFRFGYACVNFGTPISVTDHLRARGRDLATASAEERMEIVSELGETLMDAVGRVVPVLPVSLLASVFLEAPARRIGMLELKARVFERMETLSRAGAHLYLPRGDEEYAIEVGLRALLLRRMIVEEGERFAVVPGELPLLRYYANAIAHLEPRAGEEEADPASVATGASPVSSPVG